MVFNSPVPTMDLPLSITFPSGEVNLCLAHLSQPTMGSGEVR